MSTRNDNYLSLCLAQAELSHLHYRHGSIIVRGGKIIGQGFNSYRPGHVGGTVKTGVLSLTSSDRAEMAKRNKPSKVQTKRKHKSPLDKYHQDVNELTTFEMAGMGHGSNQPLSIHSEVMAIVSALSLSSGAQSSQTSARGWKYLQKPCFSVQSASTSRKTRARFLESYTQAIFEQAEVASATRTGTGKSCIQESGFETGTSQPSREEGEQPQ